MIQPSRYDARHPRHKRRHCICATCALDLGTMRDHHQGGVVLDPAAGLKAVSRRQPETGWLLICAAGHVTLWRGRGIRWFVEEQEAA